MTGAHLSRRSVLKRRAGYTLIEMMFVVGLLSIVGYFLTRMAMEMGDSTENLNVSRNQTEDFRKAFEAITADLSSARSSQSAPTIGNDPDWGQQVVLGDPAALSATRITIDPRINCNILTFQVPIDADEDGLVDLDADGLPTWGVDTHRTYTAALAPFSRTNLANVHIRYQVWPQAWANDPAAHAPNNLVEAWPAGSIDNNQLVRMLLYHDPAWPTTRYDLVRDGLDGSDRPLAGNPLPLKVLASRVTGFFVYLPPEYNAATPPALRQLPALYAGADETGADPPGQPPAPSRLYDLFVRLSFFSPVARNSGGTQNAAGRWGVTRTLSLRVELKNSEED